MIVCLCVAVMDCVVWYLVSDSNSNSVSMSSLVPPKVKLQISYNSSDQLLSVMVRHVRNLVSEMYTVPNSLENPLC